MRSVAAALLIAVGLGSGASRAQEAPPLPATELPAPEMRAVALEAGSLRQSAEATAPVRTRFAAGTVFDYYGEATDAFGRTWSVVGDPEAWRRERSWLVLPERFARTVEPGDTLAFLDTLGSPAVGSGATRRAVRVPVGWWEEPRALRVAEAPRLGELLGVPAYRVPAELIPEVLELAGGVDNLGPTPVEPVRGQLHVGRFQPLVFFWDDDWSLGDPARILSPVLGLLSNPLLTPDLAGPEELTGFDVPCWTLVGALDPAGAAVGGSDEAPEEPATVPGSARGEDPLGARDFTRLGWPVADEEVAAPRRVVLQGPASGVLLEDNSTRQAVYLEQSLPAEVTLRLRGRSLRLLAFARAVPQGENTSSVAVGIELQAGTERATVAAQVGVRSTPLSLELVVPEDAESITVRLMPQDRSIAVAERGQAVFERVSLAPSDWPAELTPDPLPLRRTLVIGYEAMRAFTRAPLALSDRARTELATAYPRLGERPVDLQRGILAGELAAGMTPEEVGLAWGEAESTEDLGDLLRWDWEGRSAAFQAGQLLAWTTSPEPPRPEPGICRTPTSGAGR